MKWDKVPLYDQETAISIDYLTRTITFYTSRYSVGNRLYKILGEPTEVIKNKDKVDGVTYRFKLSDPRSKYLLHRSLIVGGFSKDNELDERKEGK